METAQRVHELFALFLLFCIPQSELRGMPAALVCEHVLAAGSMANWGLKLKILTAGIDRGSGERCSQSLGLMMIFGVRGQPW